jgi:hypothetical protein
MRYLHIDIETLSSTDPALIDKIRAGVKPPGQYKKPESIAEWMAANAESATQEELAKTALDGLYGSIACVAWAIDDGPVMVAMQTPEQDEAALLRFAFEAMDFAATEHGNPMPLIPVGHNIEFDLRFLFQRCVRLGVKVPACIRHAFDWTSRPDVRDTMRIWAGYKGYVKLKDLSRELLGDTGTDIDGSEVAFYWKQKPLMVAEHCQADVERVRRLFKLIQGVT